MVATAAFSQKVIVPLSSNDVSQKEEHQIRQLESEILKGEMKSEPAVFEKILADDCVILNGAVDSTELRTCSLWSEVANSKKYAVLPSGNSITILAVRTTALYQANTPMRTPANITFSPDTTDSASHLPGWFSA